ncbi:ABC transporter permease [Clostridium felsineum]|uniref:Riboflavin transport system permease protein RibX n=1 Tax=Clostridium felsineum TaxID=36839 RepID=A0A1S8MG34_9CLOT|nr:ABC transporter permease [Clostridium felsineum]MCR3758793.1 ABC transporter permease [Clostridium felsineum]URZ05348.1 Riboflavin transport system permease protein RibX [Clostridium felsineum]URZ10389.1 Riboflavin transport system permease protein RibX [Clostridium felsineum]URZ17697.1 Riboflavin transport system permease protein RibX [Clostridium felsineum DSM 794]
MKVSIEHEKYIKSLNRQRHKITLTRILILIFIFVLWEIAGDLNIVDPFLISTPSRMLESFIKIYAEGTLFTHIGITCFETVIGFLLSTIIGTFIAILLWWSDFASKVLDPYLVVLNSLPKVALAPIIIFWVGNGIKAIILIAVLISIVVTIISVLNSFKEVDEEKIKLMKTFGASKFQILKNLIIPSSIPTLMSALKINVGLSWVGVIMGEFLVAKQGLGFLIVYGGQISELDMVMMSIILLSILAYLMYIAVAILEKKLKRKF